MKPKYLLAVLLLYFCVTSHAAWAGNPDIDSLISRYRRFLLQTSSSVNTDSLLTDLGTDGQWKSLDYTDREWANWKISLHLQKLRELALAWSKPDSRHYHAPALRKRIGIVLDHWLRKRYTSGNWWHNQIGVPGYMRDIIILLKDSLGQEELRQSLEVLSQRRVLRAGEGANLIWSADLGLHYAALTGDITEMDRCIGLLVEELRVAPGGEGIQPDHSFHQHGPRLQMYQYGKAYFIVSARLAWQTRGTRWAYPGEKIAILSDLLLQGWQWMARGIYTVPGTMDRSSSRPDELRGADIRYLLPFLSELAPDRKEEIRSMLDAQNGTYSLSGFRTFPYSDFTTYHQQGFSFFLKTISTRTLATESINNENLKGRLLNSGDAYYIRNGNEYYNMMPVWDWERLPGITGFTGAARIERRPFTASAGDGQSGMTAMDYCLAGKGEQARVSAKKLWVCHNGWAISMISPLQTGDSTPDAFTVLDQCRLQGEVRASTVAGAIAPGRQLLEKVGWVYHNGLGYIFPKQVRLNLLTGDVKGNWHGINRSAPDSLIRDQVFMASVEDREAAEQGLVYAVTTAASPAAMARLTRERPWKTYRNDSLCQALAFEDGYRFVAFYAAGAVRIGRTHIAVDKPCVLMIRDGQSFAGVPLHAESTIRLTVNGKSRELHP